MSRPRRVGLPWYALENYPALRTSLDDGAKLPPLYDTWRIATEQMEREVQRSGVEVTLIWRPIMSLKFFVFDSEAEALKCAEQYGGKAKVE